MFSGLHAALPIFMLHVRTKLKTNADLFQNERTKVYYIVSQLELGALDLAMAHFKGNIKDLNIANVRVLLTLLKIVFGVPNPTATAHRKLHHLKEGKGDFSIFHTQFFQLVAKLKFKENAKRDALEQAINEELKEAIIHDTGNDTDYVQFGHKLQRLVNNLCAPREKNPGTKMGSWTTLAPSNSAHTSPHP